LFRSFHGVDIGDSGLLEAQALKQVSFCTPASNYEKLIGEV
jgi:hypothetical protein